MKILIAPDSFKECLTAVEVAAAIERGIKRVLPNAKCISLPLADGGEGTISVLLHANRGHRVSVEVTGPDRRKITASYGVFRGKKTAIIEMARASGMMLVAKNKRDPVNATSFGTGEMIIHAINKGMEKIIIGLGGSATVDGGAGMAQALGIRFRNARGEVIRQKASGGMLDQIAAIDTVKIHPGIGRTNIVIAADVTNKLCGKQGAARVFAPQKGAAPEMVELLERNLEHLARIIKKDLRISIRNREGSGAAGGMGGGLVSFANAVMNNGFDLIAEQVQFYRQARNVDLIITGEGRVDSQSIRGKTVHGTGKLAKSLNIPVVAIGGALSDDSRVLFDHGIDGLASAVARDMTLDGACRNAKKYISDAAERTIRLILLGNKIKRVKSEK